MAPKHRILIVDDEADQRSLLAGFLESHGYLTAEAASGEAALKEMRSAPPDIMLLDIRLPGMSGLDTLAEIRQQDAVLPVLLITAFADVRQAVDALKRGANDYLAKPIDLEELAVAIADALGLAGDAEPRTAPDHPPVPDELVFESPAMHRLLSTLAVIAPSDAPVLVRGDTGTGKEVIANLIHQWSPRRDAPFVAANCASMPETLIESELFGHRKGAFTGAAQDRQGLFRAADGGTLFLDEIGELPTHLQPKLLRALETSQVTPVGSDQSVPVNARLVAATNRDLEAEVRAGRFREDVYYRINVVDIQLAPLCDRREDIFPLARSYARRFSGGPVRLSPQTRQCLLVHPWPGNVRELRNAMQRACLLSRGDVIMPEHLPPKIAAIAATAADVEAPAGRLSQVERATILATLAECNDNRTQAAKKLGISRRALLYKLQAIKAARSGPAQD